MLKDPINWDAVLACPRYAGGHLDALEVLFREAEVLATWHEDDYQGTEAIAYRLKDGRVVVLTDGFGSCSGCDSWEGCSDEAARHMLTSLANDAHAFSSIAEAVAWLKGPCSEDHATYYLDRAAVNLLPDLIEKQVSDPPKIMPREAFPAVDGRPLRAVFLD